MDKSKINVMFGKFLVDLLAAEATEDEGDIEQLEQPKLVEAPTGGWTNEYDRYMFGIVNKIIEDYGMERETAQEIVLSVAGVMAERKHLPVVPKGASDDEKVTAWLAAAEKIEFAKHVIGMTDKMMQEVVKEVADEPDDKDENDD
jgi:hypothetical protein